MRTIAILFTIFFMSIGDALSEEAKDLTNIKPAEKIQIDIVSDVVCPWCAIGYKRLSQAIDELDVKDKVVIVWHPFQLNPNMPQEGINANEYLMKKMRLTPQGLKDNRERVSKTAKESGFEFDYFDDMRKPNTLYSHVLLDYAKEFNKQTELKVRLQKAYFSERKNIGNRDVLYSELENVGLNADEGMKKLDDIAAVKRVQAEERAWRQLGISSIPTMVFGKRAAYRGANSVEQYKKILTALLNDQHT